MTADDITALQRWAEALVQTGLVQAGDCKVHDIRPGINDAKESSQ